MFLGFLAFVMLIDHDDESANRLTSLISIKGSDIDEGRASARKTLKCKKMSNTAPR